VAKQGRVFTKSKGVFINIKEFKEKLSNEGIEIVGIWFVSKRRS
jgi:hypothetical protein